jgi:hypothetical protein
MKDESLEALYKKYPGLFKQDNLYFECGDGWYHIIDCLAQQIDFIIEEDKLDREFCYVSQVKEKYGILRVYMASETDKMSALIRFAEDLSAMTCEVCGSPGRMNMGRWLEVRCDSHSKSVNNDRNQL